MFGLNEKTNFELVIREKQNFSSILLNLTNCLKASENNAQARYVGMLLELIKEGNLGQFVNSLNAVDMWGGSGAVWEVYIEDNAEYKKFQGTIVGLIDLMESTKILKKGIAPIRQAFLMDLTR